jgi:hypothetical protein
MMTFPATRLMRRSLATLVIVTVLGIGLFATAAPASANGNPFGQVTNSYSGALFGYASGWAVDPDALWTPIDVHVDATYYSARCSKLGCQTYPAATSSWTQTANRQEATMMSDPAYALLFGPWHGFDIHLVRAGETVSVGASGYLWATACVTAVNVGPGSDASLGCFDLEPELT